MVVILMGFNREGATYTAHGRKGRVFIAGGEWGHLNELQRRSLLWLLCPAVEPGQPFQVIDVETDAVMGQGTF